MATSYPGCLQQHAWVQARTAKSCFPVSAAWCLIISCIIQSQTRFYVRPFIGLPKLQTDWWGPTNWNQQVSFNTLRGAIRTRDFLLHWVLVEQCNACARITMATIALTPCIAKKSVNSMWEAILQHHFSAHLVQQVVTIDYGIVEPT